MILWGRNEGLGFQMAAMASAAGDGGIRVGNLGYVILIDVLGHAEHQPGRRLLGLGVVGVFEPGPAVGTDIVGVCGMAGAAMGA